MQVLAARAIDLVPAIAVRAAVSCLLLPACLCSTVVHAQFAANVTLSTSDVFRGESTSNDDAAASFELTYDHPSGVFAGASITVAGGEHNPHFNGSIQYIGYTASHGMTSFELGLIHRRYRARSLVDEAYSPDYFEGFVGISRRNFKVRLYVSPDYLRDSRTTYYGEANARLLKAGKWSVDGHLGISLIPPDPGSSGIRAHYDWSIQASRPIGRLTLGLGIAASNYQVFSPDRGAGFLENKPRVFATISQAF